MKSIRNYLISNKVNYIYSDGHGYNISRIEVFDEGILFWSQYVNKDQVMTETKSPTFIIWGKINFISFCELEGGEK